MNISLQAVQLIQLGNLCLCCLFVQTQLTVQIYSWDQDWRRDRPRVKSGPHCCIKSDGVYEVFNGTVPGPTEQCHTCKTSRSPVSSFFAVRPISKREFPEVFLFEEVR